MQAITFVGLGLIPFGTVMLTTQQPIVREIGFMLTCVLCIMLVAHRDQQAMTQAAVQALSKALDEAFYKVKNDIVDELRNEIALRHKSTTGGDG